MLTCPRPLHEGVAAVLNNAYQQLVPITEGLSGYQHIFNESNG